MYYHYFASIDQTLDEVRAKGLPDHETEVATRLVRFLDAHVSGRARTGRSQNDVFQWVPAAGATEFVSCYVRKHPWLEWKRANLTEGLSLPAGHVERFRLDVAGLGAKMVNDWTLYLCKVAEESRCRALEYAIIRLFDKRSG